MIRLSAIHYDLNFCLYFFCPISWFVYWSKRHKLSLLLFGFNFRRRIWFNSRWWLFWLFLLFSLLLFYSKVSLIFLSLFDLFSFSNFIKGSFLNISVEFFLIQKPSIIFTVTACSLCVLNVFICCQSAKKLTFYIVYFIVLKLIPSLFLKRKLL